MSREKGSRFSREHCPPANFPTPERVNFAQNGVFNANMCQPTRASNGRKRSAHPPPCPILLCIAAALQTPSAHTAFGVEFHELSLAMNLLNSSLLGWVSLALWAAAHGAAVLDPAIR